MTRPNFSISLPAPMRHRWSPGNPNAGWTSVADSEFASETISGVSRHKPQTGFIAPTSYSFFRRAGRRPVGLTSYGVNSTNWDEVLGSVGGPTFNALNHYNLAISEAGARTTLSTSAAIAAARNRIKGKQVDLGVAFAERKQTTQLVGDTARRLARAAQNMQRGQYRRAMRDLGIIGDVKKPRGSNWTNHWLQSQYAWRPLLSDVYGSCNALSKRDKGDWRVTATASRGDEERWSASKFPQGVTYPTANFDACRVEAVRHRGVFVRIDALPGNDLTMSLSSLGVTNPLLVAWELVPYSFVVDWFLPVGSWLNSLDALLGYTDIWSSVTTYNRCNWKDVGLSKTWSKFAYVRNDYVGTKEIIEVQRTASSGAPFPSFPSFKDPRSLGHMANGLSLLAQAFGRR